MTRSLSSFVRSSVCPFVFPFFYSQVFLQFDAYHVKQAVDYCFRSHILHVMSITKALKLQFKAEICYKL